MTYFAFFFKLIISQEEIQLSEHDLPNLKIFLSSVHTMNLAHWWPLFQDIFHPRQMYQTQHEEEEKDKKKEEEENGEEEGFLL